MFKMEKKIKKKKKAMLNVCLADFIYESLLWEGHTVMGDNNCTRWGS